jgi:hypothetical protein
MTSGDDPEITDAEAQDIYDKLADDSAMDEAMMALDPGTTIAFPDGVVVHRHADGWEYQDESGGYSGNGDTAPEAVTPEQAFRQMLGRG